MQWKTNCKQLLYVRENIFCLLMVKLQLFIFQSHSCFNRIKSKQPFSTMTLFLREKTIKSAVEAGAGLGAGSQGHWPQLRSDWPWSAPVLLLICPLPEWRCFDAVPRLNTEGANESNSTNQADRNNPAEKHFLCLHVCLGAFFSFIFYSKNECKISSFIKYITSVWVCELSGSRCVRYLYLPRSLHVDGDDLEAVAAKLTGPAAALADPLQQALLVGVPHRAVTPARVQQVTLQTYVKEIPFISLLSSQRWIFLQLFQDWTETDLILSRMNQEFIFMIRASVKP